MRKCRLSKLTAQLGIALAISISLNADAAVHCGGTVALVGLGSDGNVNVTLFGSQAVQTNAICNVNSQGSFQVSTSACKSIYGALVVSKLQGNTVGLYYNDAALASCASIPAWSVQPSFYFFELA